MTVEDSKPCDTDDIICKMEVLRHLKGLEEHLGVDQFRDEFPEATVLQEKITSKISQQEEIVQEALIRCAEEEEIEVGKDTED